MLIVFYYNFNFYFKVKGNGKSIFNKDCQILLHKYIFFISLCIVHILLKLDKEILAHVEFMMR